MVKKTRGTKRRRRRTHKAAKKQRGGGKELDSSIKQQEQPYAHEQVMELTKQWRENLSACQKDNDELKARVTELEAKNDVLKAKVTELKAGNNALKAKVTELEANVAAVLPPPWSPAWIKMLHDVTPNPEPPHPNLPDPRIKRVNALISRLENGEQVNILPLGWVYLGPPKMMGLPSAAAAAATARQKSRGEHILGPLGRREVYRVEDNKLVGQLIRTPYGRMSIKWWRANEGNDHDGWVHHAGPAGGSWF